MISAADDAYKTFKNAEGLQQGGQSLQAFGSRPAVGRKVWRRNTTTTRRRNTPSIPTIRRRRNMGRWRRSSTRVAAVGSPLRSRACFARAYLNGLGGLGRGDGRATGAVMGGIAGNALTYGCEPAAGAVLGARARRGVQQSINDAYPALTGQTINPAGGGLSPAIKALIFGNLAGSGY